VAVTIDVPALIRTATTIDTWQNEVLAFFDNASDTPTESGNVKITSIRQAARRFSTAITRATLRSGPQDPSRAMFHRAYVHLTGVCPSTSKPFQAILAT
jgi:hypothetical protein